MQVNECAYISLFYVFLAEMRTKDTYRYTLGLVEKLFGKGRFYRLLSSIEVKY